MTTPPDPPAVIDTLRQLDELLTEIRLNHRDPAHEGYNECEKDECAWCSQSRELMQQAIQARTALQQQIERSLAVLQPSMPESGLEDACRQVKQAAISAADNCEHLERMNESLQQQIEALRQERDEARAIVANVNNEVVGSQGYFTTPSCIEAIWDLKTSHNRLVNENRDLQQRITSLEQQIAEMKEEAQ